MKFKRVILILLIIFLCLDVSFASADNEITGFFSDLNGFTEKISTYFIEHFSAGNSSIFKGNNHVKISFNSSDLVKDYNNSSQYKLQILADGKPVGPGEKVNLRINGVDYVKTTDENGTVHLDINLQPGNYILYCEYKTYKTYNNIKVI